MGGLQASARAEAPGRRAESEERVAQQSELVQVCSMKHIMKDDAVGAMRRRVSLLVFFDDWYRL